MEMKKRMIGKMKINNDDIYKILFNKKLTGIQDVRENARERAREREKGRAGEREREAMKALKGKTGES